MKLPELKRRFNKKYVVRVVAGVLTIALVGSGVTAYNVRAEKDGKNQANLSTEVTEEVSTESLSSLLSEVSVEQKEIGKSETVYFLSDANGTVTKTIVSDHLINADGSSTIKDRSNLKNIENVKGEEKFEQNGNDLTWNADGKDIYYQGTTDAEAPITQKVTYYLDGAEISPEDLAGKSGKVTIHYDYTNNTSFEETVNGQKVNVVVPFAAMTAVVLNDNFKNVEVSHGRIENMASGTVCVGYALPGIIESLEAEEGFFSEDLDVPEFFEITADVENFELQTAMTAVVNAGSLTDVNSDVDMSEIDSMINTLSDASEKLEDGSKQLSEGLTTLKSKLGDFTTGMNSLNKGIVDYTDGASKVSTGIETLNASIPSLTDGVTKLKSGADQVATNMAKLVKGSAAVTAGAEKLSAGTTEMKKGISTLQTQLAAALTSAGELKKQEQAVGAVFNAMKTYKVAAKDYEAGVDKVVGAQVAAGVEEKDAEITAAVTAAVYANVGINAETYAQLEAAAQSKAAIDAAATDDEKHYLAGQVAYASASAEDKAAIEAQINAGVQAQVPGLMAQYGLTQEQAIEQAKPLVTNAVLTAVGTAKYETVYTTLNGYATNKAAIDEAIVKNVAEQKQSLIAAKTQENTASLKNDSLKGLYAAFLADSNAIDATSFISGYVSGSETALKTVQEGAKKLATGADTLESGAKELHAGAKQVSDGVSELNEKGIKPLKDGMKSLNDSIPTLTGGVTELNNGAKTLVSNNDKLKSGASQLVDGTAQIVDGVGKLEDGSKTLYDGMVQFNNEGIERIVNAYRGDIKPLSNKIQGMIDASNSYETFTDKADGVNANVKFVYKLDSITADKKDAE